MRAVKAVAPPRRAAQGAGETPDERSWHRGAGTRAATVTPAPPPPDVPAEHDDALLAAYVDGRPTDPGPAPARLTAACVVHPVHHGSAITGAGVDELIGGITTLLPRPAPRRRHGVQGGRGPGGEKVASVRMVTGHLGVRERMGADRNTGIDVCAHGTTVPRRRVVAGEIALLRGLSAVRIGDRVGATVPAAAAPGGHFAPPGLETVVAPVHPRDRGTPPWPD